MEFSESVIDNKHVNCLEASVLLMYSFFGRERNALVYTFTENSSELKPLHETLPKTTFSDAMRFCEDLVMDQTHPDLGAPLSEATRQKKSIDIFVTIVDSIVRFNRKAIAPTEQFKKYKEKFNKHAK